MSPDTCLSIQIAKDMSHDESEWDDEDEEDLLDLFHNNKKRIAPLFKTKTVAILASKQEMKLSRANSKQHLDWSDLFKECRVRDPFQIRDLRFELKEILHTFDLVTYGESMGKFVIELLRTRNLASLWTFLGLLLKTMPNKTALKIMYENRTQLRRAKPQDLDWLCGQVIQGTRFIIPACLFFSHFMRENAKDDLSRDNIWERYSKKYEDFAAEQVLYSQRSFLIEIRRNLNDHDLVDV